MSRTPRPPRPRRTAPGPPPVRRAGGPRLPGISPAALPATGPADWYRRAVFYEVLTRGFFDANDDGIGDLAGLRAKLDYLEWLGVDCLWLLPYYPSPMRDGGYDISDFFTVHPNLGTLDDLVAFLDDAHRRGIRVIADLVMNHTSDQHPWFIESRSSRDNPKADWYVWNDDDQRWADARVVFVDVETSNWTYEMSRQQYYWHRFYSHQPDLNYENPEVVEAMFDVVRFWLDLGLDGFRLDAVPYLFQRDGTSGENLPETHTLLRRLRKEMDSVYPDRVMLAEANQWPADLVDYFGDGDECHMCFHFPLMPRLFMAVRREQRFPVTEILAQTPVIPDGCQWAIFLRNHDELTLEKVSEEERDYMVAEYVKDPRMRRHMGIGRRLAPLLDGDRRLAQLLYALLFSLPGSPVIYYGDELLMGDNLYLGDRDSVRTPMQWSPDRNGGFSRADFAQLYLPPLMDPVYGYEAVNVEAQQRNPSSFLHWIRSLLQTRKQFPVFGTGSFEVVPCANPSVLAYVRSPSAPVPGTTTAVASERSARGRGGRAERAARASGSAHGGAAAVEPNPVLCVHNLSRFAQPAELDLARWADRTPVELLGRVPFPSVGAATYGVTLGPYGFYWFELIDHEAGANDEGSEGVTR
jgi:maltose alpha-D-glucosyltransferase/alpha-amylase